MCAVTRSRQFLCVAGVVLQFLILLKCCAITVAISTPGRASNNVSATAEFMTLRAVGRSVRHCLAATEHWQCFEDQLLRFVDALAQDNSTWQLGDYIFVEKLTSNKSHGRTEKQQTFSKNQAPGQRSLQADGDSQHNESGIATSLLQLAKTRSIRMKLPNSVGTLKKIGAGISDAIDGLALQNIALSEMSPETEAAQADEGTHRLFHGLVDDKLETFNTKFSVSSSKLDKDKDNKKKKEDKHKKTKKKKITKNESKHTNDIYKYKDEREKGKDKYKDKDNSKQKKDKYKDKDKHKDKGKYKKVKDKDKHKKKPVITEGLLHNYNSLKGRKKKGKDKNMAMMGGMAMMAMVAQMFLGKVILIAGAAFVMAKIALLVSVLGSLKKGTNTERIVVTGQGHGGGGDHSEYGHDEGWHRRMPHTYPVTEIISEEPQPVNAHHQSPIPPPPLKPSASHQNYRFYVNEINEAVNEDIDDGYRRRQAQTGFL